MFVLAQYKDLVVREGFQEVRIVPGGQDEKFRIAYPLFRVLVTDSRLHGGAQLAQRGAEDIHLFSFGRAARCTADEGKEKNTNRGGMNDSCTVTFRSEETHA